MLFMQNLTKLPVACKVEDSTKILIEKEKTRSGRDVIELGKVAEFYKS
jgi:hypothetical protein